MSSTSEQQYLDLLRKINNKGTWVHNKRTNTNCKTIINADLVYDVGKGEFPLLTTRKSYWKQAIGEMIGYIRGYDSVKQFNDIGVHTWDKNANENIAWLNNPNRKGDGDLGRIYGVQGRRWINKDGQTIDQLKTIIKKLSAGIDDRALIWTFYNPGETELGCLKPCMHTHTFSILNDKLYLTSIQRSWDGPLGGNFNMVQCYFLLAVIAKITGLQPGKVYHKIINAHIYENQINNVDILLTRIPFKPSTFHISDNINTLEDLETCSLDEFSVKDYTSHPPINFNFTV